MNRGRRMGRSPRVALIAGGAAALFSTGAQAAVSYSTVDSVYGENFNTLATSGTANTWTNNSTISGFYIFRSGSTSATTGIQRGQPDGPANELTWAPAGSYRTNNTANSRIYSWGTGTDAERALGGVTGSSTTAGFDPGDMYFAMVFQNLTGETLDSFTLDYTGEQWAVRTATTPVQSLHFDYLVKSGFNALADVPTTDNFGSYTAVPDLDFVAPQQNAATGVIDGNNAANRNELSATVDTGFSWAPNDYLILRWWDDDSSGEDYGFGIDDISFTASAAPIPEPASITSLIIGGAMLLNRRRRQRS